MGAAIAKALTAAGTAGQTYELGGPGVYTFKALMELVLKETHHKRALVPVPFPIAEVMGAVAQLIAVTPYTPPITRDQVELLKSDNVAGGLGLADLGITPTVLESILPTYLWKYRRGGQFAELEAAKRVVQTWDLMARRLAGAAAGNAQVSAMARVLCP